MSAVATTPTSGGAPDKAPARLSGSRQLASPRGHASKVVSNVILVIIGVVFLVPLAWIVLGAFNPNASVSISWPSTWTWDNFAAITTWETTYRPLVNSAILSFGCAIVTVVCAVLAAYPLSRYQMRFHRSLMYVILFGTCLPITAMMVPVYALFVSLHLLNTLWGTILFLGATSLPMAIWMTKNFMDSIPISLEEAAWVDGASSMTALWRIVVPLMRNGIAVVFIFVFTGAWGNFFVPFVLIFSRESTPAAVAIFGFFGNYGTVAYGQLAAFSIMYSLPVLVLYLVVQKLSGNSFAMSGAVKG